jgi:nickel/cobalt exporter
LVGARGKPIDAVILGVFVTLSHTSGILLVGVLASVGSAWLVPARVEAYLGLSMGILIVGLGLWMLWAQRNLIALAMGDPITAIPAQAGVASFAYHTHDGDHTHAHRRDEDAHDHGVTHTHPHTSHSEPGWHTHAWGTSHSHQMDFVTENRPTLGVLLTLAIAGGILPDPTALAILLAALSSGKVLLGLATVVVFSLGFAATLVVVGIIAAQVGQTILGWLSSIWAVRVQIATTLLILGMGVVLTIRAAYQIAPP